MFLRLAIQSLKSRSGSVVLTLLAMTMSIIVLLGVEHIRTQAKESFSSTVSNVDLVVGARTGSINLLLYSVFRIGNPVNNISWDTYEKIESLPEVKWAIPIALGDSHQGYKVVGTTPDYFEFYKFGDHQSLTLKQGSTFSSLYDVVIGSEVAKKLNYKVGDKIVLAHGVAATSFTIHKDSPFTIVGILNPTGTPVDQSLHVSLEAIEAIHLPAKQRQAEHLNPKAITAFMLGLKSKVRTFQVQSFINDYRGEPMQAILPGVALIEILQKVSMVVNSLRLISYIVLISSLLGLSALLLASVRERQQDIRILRMLGASPLFVFCLIELEAILVTLFSIVFSVAVLSVVFFGAKSFLASEFGIFINSFALSGNGLMMLLVVFSGTILTSLLPAIAAYLKASRKI